MPSCSAVNCESKKGTRLFRFPRDPLRRKKWAINCRRDNWKPKNGSSLCENHFEESQFELKRADQWKKLKATAIPTLFNVPNPPPKIDTTDSFDRRGQRKRPADLEESKTPIMRANEYLNKMSAILLKYRENGFLCDTLLVTANQTYHAHSAVLATSSKTFKEMYEHFMKVGDNSSCGPYKIHLTGFSTDEVEAALHYIYTGKLRIPDTCTSPSQLSTLLASLGKLGLDLKDLNGCQLQFYKNSSSEIGLHAVDQLSTDEKVTANIELTSSPNGLTQKKAFKIGQSDYLEKNASSTNNSTNNSVRSDDETRCQTIQPKQISLREIPFVTGLKESTIEVCNKLLKRVAIVKETTPSVSIMPTISFISGGPLQQQQLRQKEECYEDDKEHSYDKRSRQTIAANKYREHDEHSYDRFGGVKMISVKKKKKKKKTEEDDEASSFKKNLDHVCHACGIVLKTAAGYRSHFRKIHSMNNRCRFCHQNFTGREELELHVRTTHQNEVVNSTNSGRDESLTDDAVQRKKNKKLIPKEITSMAQKRMYSCTNCTKTFENVARFRWHKIYHVLPWILKYTMIQRSSTTTKTALLTTTLANNAADSSFGGDGRRSKERFSCGSCGQSFSTQSHLDFHALSHEKQCSELKCSVCHQIFVSEYRMRCHMKRSHGDSEYQCLLCHLGFQNVRELGIHFRLHTGERPYQCNLCGQSYMRETILKRHIRNMHNADKGHLCNTCGKVFVQRSHLLNHMNVHTREKPFQCKFCKKEYRQRGALYSHLKSHAEDLHCCRICKRTFFELKNLQKHVALHDSGVSHPCNECGKTFLTNANLVLHKRFHRDGVIGRRVVPKKLVKKRCPTKLIKYGCPTCDKVLSSHYYLKVHERVHSGEKPYLCHDCGMAFNNPTAHRVHARTHTGERPYVCQFCAKTFAQQHTLTVHTRVHTGERPYVCNICGKGYKERKNIKQHIERTHPGVYEDSKSKNMEGIINYKVK